VMQIDHSGFLACPPGIDYLYKDLYDERIYIINKVLDKLVYPHFGEISIHENKKYLSSWLKANHLPLPKTYVFYNKGEALEYIRSVEMPIVAKMNIGASGKGVRILQESANAEKYVDQAFGKGIRQAWGPNIKMGDYQNRVTRLVKDPSIIISRLKAYRRNYEAMQKGFVIFQEYVPHDYEWRVVKIGDSYFGHQKVKQGFKASGTKGIDYIPPSDGLLNFIKELCEKHQFNCMAIDLFEDGNEGYLINELQCIFGHVQDHICEKNGKPGRFHFLNDEWVFEEGLFNSNESYDLRLENAVSLINNL